MSFKRLEEVLLQEAATRVDALRDEYQRQFEKEEKRVGERAQAVEEAVISEAQSAAELEGKRLHQAAQLDGRALVLTAKQEELDATEADTVAQILAWDASQTKQLLEALLALVPKEPGTLIVGAAHQDVMQELAAAGKHTVAEQPLPDDGGFVYQGETTELNLTVSYLVEQVFKQHKTEIAKALFG